MQGSKLIVITLIASIIFSALLSLPRKASADTETTLRVIGGSLASCAVQQAGTGYLKRGIDVGIKALKKEAGNFIKSALKKKGKKAAKAAAGGDVGGAVGAIIGGDSVPVKDEETKEKVEETKDELETFKIQEFTEKTLECAAIRAANFLLDDLTKKTVNWIATGNFDGGPLYVPNLNVYIRDQASFASITFYNQMREFMARGQWEFGDVVFESVFINSAGRPFTSNIKPVPRPFMRNFSQGSWNTFLDLAHPYGNPMGQTLAAIEEKDELESAAGEEALEEVRQGQGFIPQKTQRVCIQRGSQTGGCMRFAPQTITAPGKTISGLADKALGTDLSRLELANRVDHITQALINRLLRDVFKNTGFSARFESFSPTQITINISVSPGTVTEGESFTIKWNHNGNPDVTQCYLSGGETFEQLSGSEAKSGQKVIETADFGITKTVDITYQYTCTHRTTGASGGASVDVTVKPTP